MTDFNPVTQVEDQDDIGSIPATVSGTGAADKTSTELATKHEDNTQGASSVNINTSDLPPHIVLEMPALSPTMVRAALAIKFCTMLYYHFQSFFSAKECSRLYFSSLLSTEPGQYCKMDEKRR